MEGLRDQESRYPEGILETGDSQRGSTTRRSVGEDAGVGSGGGDRWRNRARRTPPSRRRHPDRAYGTGVRHQPGPRGCVSWEVPPRDVLICLVACGHALREDRSCRRLARWSITCWNESGNCSRRRTPPHVPCSLRRTPTLPTKRSSLGPGTNCSTTRGCPTQVTSSAHGPNSKTCTRSVAQPQSGSIRLSASRRKVGYLDRRVQSSDWLERWVTDTRDAVSARFKEDGTILDGKPF